jgi:DNA primase
VALLTQDSIDRVRAAANIVDVVSAHTDMRRQGTRFLGLCPFHDERTPSFSVNPSENLYYCFGCQASGDVFTFLQEKEGLEFREAVEQLADRYGIELTYESVDQEEEARRRGRDRLFEVLNKTADFYQRYLWESAEAGKAREYLAGRGLGREVLEEFGVGFAPSAWDKVLTRALSAGFTEQELHNAGLIQKGRRGGFYDRFRERIMFPLRDARGRVVGFGARAMRDNQPPKYVNSPEGPVYRKGRSLFAIDIARSHATKAGQVIVVEGYTDVLALHQGGIKNSVASMGTAMTDEQVAELARLGREVILAFDADRSGQEAMLRVQEAAGRRRLDLKVVRLPDDKDPSDLLQVGGSEAFLERLKGATSFLEFQVQTVIERADLSSPAGKDAALAELAPVFAAAEPSAERDEQMRLVAGRLDLSEHLLAPLMSRPPQSAPGRQSGERSAPTPRAGGAATRAERWERIFLAMCVSSGERGHEYLERLEDEHLSSDVLRRARSWIAEHFESPTRGLPLDDEQLAHAVSEIVVRSSGQPAGERALEVGFLGLERRRLEGAIKQAGESEDFGRQRELSATRTEITERIVRLMSEEDDFSAEQQVSSSQEQRDSTAESQ